MLELLGLPPRCVSRGLALCGCGACSGASLRFLGGTGRCVTEDIEPPRCRSRRLPLCGCAARSGAFLRFAGVTGRCVTEDIGSPRCGSRGLPLCGCAARSGALLRFPGEWRGTGTCPAVPGSCDGTS